MLVKLFFKILIFSVFQDWIECIFEVAQKQLTVLKVIFYFALINLFFSQNFQLPLFAETWSVFVNRNSTIRILRRIAV